MPRELQQVQPGVRCPCRLLCSQWGSREMLGVGDPIGVGLLQDRGRICGSGAIEELRASITDWRVKTKCKNWMQVTRTDTSTHTQFASRHWPDGDHLVNFQWPAGIYMWYTWSIQHGKKRKKGAELFIAVRRELLRRFNKITIRLTFRKRDTRHLGRAALFHPVISPASLFWSLETKNQVHE